MRGLFPLSIAGIALLALPPLQAFGQEFDAASIHLSPPGARGGGFGFAPGRLQTKNTNLRALIAFAWDIADYQIEQTPGWTESEHYEITATFPADSTDSRIRTMLRALLATEFQVRMHSSKKEIKGFALVQAKGPQKIKPAATEETSMMLGRNPEGLRTLTAKTRTMQSLASMLSELLGRPVEDRTGLAGSFDFQVAWMPDPVGESAISTGKLETPGDSAGPSIYSAVEQSLGLKLESTKLLADSWTLDHAAAPSVQ